MTDVIVVLCTCASRSEANRIAMSLVEDRLAACVNILPAIQSIYRWQDVVEHADEVLLVVKTTQERFPALKERVTGLHSYDTPEIIALPIAAGSDKYLEWIREQL